MTNLNSMINQERLAQATAASSVPRPIRPEVRCQCGFVLFDGDVVRARVIRLQPRGAEAKCRCKRWVAVPLTYAPRA